VILPREEVAQRTDPVTDIFDWHEKVGQQLSIVTKKATTGRGTGAIKTITVSGMTCT
jgi:hypothetical protein